MEVSFDNVRPTPTNDMPRPAPAPHHRPKRGMPFGNLASVVILFSVAVVAAAVIALFVFGGDGKSEKNAIKDAQYQAVFLDDANGQVYFGNLSVFNDKFYMLSDIFYVRVEQVQPETATDPAQNISLAKLGNELHGPEDAMYISRDKVLFWENLKDDGKVVTAIVEYKKNPPADTETTKTE